MSASSKSWMTPERYPGLWTDLHLLGAESRVVETEEALIIHTDDRLDFWCGNCAMLRHEPTDVASAISLWRPHFLNIPVQRALIQWELAGARQIPSEDALEAVDILTMTNRELLAGREGRYIRIEDSSAFEQVVQMTLYSQRSGSNSNRDDAYTRWQYQDYWKQMQAQKLSWYAAYDGDQLCSACGVTVGGGVARYIDVLTAVNQRGRGWADGVVRYAALCSFEEANLLVIAAEPDSIPGRIYRKIGFVPSSVQISLSLDMADARLRDERPSLHREST
jgi:hypothetical protein